jgi:hypothetical protein
MSNNQWLYSEIVKGYEAELSPRYDPLIEMTIEGQRVGIYTPDVDEYIVNSDVVEKASELGATIISYSSSWCSTTAEAQQHARKLGITIMPHRSLFAYLRRAGIKEKNKEVEVVSLDVV